MASEHVPHGGHPPTHIVALPVYIGVFVALLVLTGVTTAVAFVDLGPMNNVVALTIAVVKAALVILFFMHIKYSSRLNALVVVASLFWIFLLFAGTLHDYLTRGILGVVGK
ncbi:MAG: cytochrome C oxidase subunit IV family protein [Thermoanaerobaculia bacterium]